MAHEAKVGARNPSRASNRSTLNSSEKELTLCAGVSPPSRLSLIKTPSHLESMVQEAELLRRIVEEESDICELDKN
jgi:hypothetical protein